MTDGEDHSFRWSTICSKRPVQENFLKQLPVSHMIMHVCNVSLTVIFLVLTLIWIKHLNSQWCKPVRAIVPPATLGRWEMSSLLYILLYQQCITELVEEVGHDVSWTRLRQKPENFGIIIINPCYLAYLQWRFIHLPCLK